MSSTPIISVNNLGKKYVLRHQTEHHRYKTLRDVIAEKTRRLRTFRKQSSPMNLGPRTEDFWALNHVSFEIEQGQIVGIVGRNGAGKSTLLKILSRITEPTTGQVRLRGRVASLLEVGTGFHPELTGRENIYLNGAILGMSRSEIKRKFDEIVAFAEVEKFLDTAVKHYSSGMYVRLAFAVAAHLEPEILVVDEILAVGDTEFQKKCLGKMEDVAKGEGRTILFVSHNMSAIRALCSRAILLKSGRVVASDTADRVIDGYLSCGTDAESTWERPSTKSAPPPPIHYRRIQAIVTGAQPALQLVVDAEIICDHSQPAKTFVSIDVCDALGSPLMQAIPVGRPFLDLSRGSNYVQLTVDLPGLTPGQYLADFWIGTHYSSTLDYIKQAISISIETSPIPERIFPHSSDHGFMIAPSRCDVRIMVR